MKLQRGDVVKIGGEAFRVLDVLSQPGVGVSIVQFKELEKIEVVEAEVEPREPYYVVVRNQVTGVRHAAILREIDTNQADTIAAQGKRWNVTQDGRIWTPWHPTVCGYGFPDSEVEWHETEYDCGRCNPVAGKVAWADRGTL